MEFEAIAEFYRTQIGIEKESTVQLLAENTQFRHRKRGEQLLTAGEKMTVILFHLNGVGRAYVVDDEGHEVVMGFVRNPCGALIGASGIQEHIIFNIEAVTEMDTLELPIPILQDAIKHDPDCALIYHRVLMEDHDAKIEWQIARQTKKGKARYLWFLDRKSVV